MGDGLTNFENQGRTFTGKGNAERCFEKIVKSQQLSTEQTEVTSFWRVFIIWTAGVSKKAQVERHEIISCACS